MKISVIIFPGSNCDHDVAHVYAELLGGCVKAVWHRDRELHKPDIVVLPGGFSYGDYLRTGALAKLSPAMEEVAAFARRGGKVLGICNGFQILCEAGLLPGALLQNRSMRFLSRFVHMRIEISECFFTQGCRVGDIVTCPIAHFEGNYFAAEDDLKRIEDGGQVVVRYCDGSGRVLPLDPQFNPNGSLNAIAGICNEGRNVIGLMPHPERAVEDRIGWLGGSTGLCMFRSSLAA